jgi:hypothetical protein
MPQAQSSNRQLAYIIEANYGVTPPTPQPLLLDYVSFNFDLNPEDIVSRSITSHRQLTDVRRGNTSAAGNLVFELNPTNADAFLEAGLMGTWTTNVLKIGKVFRSFTFEEGYSDLVQYRVMNGGVINSIGMTLGSGNYAEVTCGIVGKTLSQWTGTSIDTTPTVAAVGSKFYHDGGAFKIAGTTVGSMSSLSWTLDHGFAPAFALGSTDVRTYNYAPQMTLKGKIGGLFETVAEMNKFITNTESSMQYQLIAGTDSLDTKISSLNYTNVSYDTGSAGVSVEMDFTAKYNVSDASSMVMTRV